MQTYLKKWFPLFVLPTLAAFLIAFLIPFFMGLYLSFTSFTTVTDAKWVGLDNYVAAFRGDGHFLRALGFTSLFTLVSVITVNLFAFLLALALTKAFRFTNVFRSVFFMPNLIGGIVLGYIWQIIINGLLLPLGVDVTYSAAYGFWGLAVMTNWQLIGYMMILYIAALQGIPPQLYEASAIDGATPSQSFCHITLPSVANAFTICLFLTLTNSFKLFDQNLALTDGAPARESSMLALDIYKTFYGRVGQEGVGQRELRFL